MVSAAGTAHVDDHGLARGRGRMVSASATGAHGSATAAAGAHGSAAPTAEMLRSLYAHGGRDQQDRRHKHHASVRHVSLFKMPLWVSALKAYGRPPGKVPGIRKLDNCLQFGDKTAHAT